MCHLYVFAILFLHLSIVANRNQDTEEMAIYENGIRYQLRNNSSYSSLPAGFEIAVPPDRAISPPKLKSLYVHKPLPAIPTKSRNRRLGRYGGLDFVEIPGKQRVSTFPTAKNGCDRRGSIRKMQQITGLMLGAGTRHPTLEKVAGNSNILTDGGPPQLPEIARLTEYDHCNPTDTFSGLRRYVSPDSFSSGSLYSQGEAVEDVVDAYYDFSSCAPNPESPTSPVKRSLYLQPSTYSASADELRYSGRTADVRQPSCASLDKTQSLQDTMTTLSDLMKEERERRGGNSLASNIDQIDRGSATTSNTKQSLPKQNEFKYLSWNEDETTKRTLTPEPLALRPRNLREPHQTISRFSDHSSEADRGIISNARDSVISHIRSIPSAFKAPSRLSMAFKEKVGTSTAQLSLAEPGNRKGTFSSSRHPLKSPFPFRSPLHKKVHEDNCPNQEGSRFVRRISDAFKRFSNARTSPFIDSRIISNHARTANGPDTPMPTKPGLIGFRSPTGIFHRGTLPLQDAVRKAKRSAGVRSRDERRRDKLRKAIVVVGTSEQPPSTPMTRWL